MLDKLDMSAIEIRAHLLELAEERVAAEEMGMDADPVYMAHLEAEVLAYRFALVAAQVTEIAVARSAMLGPNVG